MRLIDADALISYMDECSKESRFRVYTGYAETFIDLAPTVDAVEVVRCKDCKYCNISLVLPTGRKMYNCMEGSHDHQTLLKSNDFCSRGETRKDREYIDSEKKGGEEE